MQGVARYRRLTVIVCSFVLFFQLLVASAALSCLYLSACTRLSSTGRAPAEAPRREPAAEYPAGWWQRYQNEPDGYALALPPDWRVVPLNSEAPPEAEGAAPGEAAVVQRLVEWARERLDAGWGTWVATARDGPLGNATSINIVREPLQEEVPVEDYAGANLQSLREESGTVSSVSERWLDLAAGRALQVQVTYQLPSDEGEGRQLSMVQVYLVRDGNGYVVTGVTRPEYADGYLPVFEGIVGSLRWTS